MTNEEFAIEIENSISRSKKVLIEKGKEYSGEIDRLENFKRAGAAQSIPPTEALYAMAMKHIVSIADMVKCPEKFTMKQWYAKTGDLRNYTILLEALLIDGIEK